MLLSEVEYLDIGRRIVPLLGSALSGPSAQALRELARAYDPGADDSRISAEVFLFHKYLLMQACVGVFPEAHVDHVVGGLFAALNERASGLELGPDRQQAMEAVWQQRAGHSISPFHKTEFCFLMKGLGRPTGSRRSADSVKTYEPWSAHRISGPGTMARLT
ncbi:MAG: hypothetical protein AABY61_10410 [Nitrospirota bacterium]